MFTTDFYICGIGPLDDHLVVLAYSKQTDMQLANIGVDSRRWAVISYKLQIQKFNINSYWHLYISRPQMRVLEPFQRNFEELSKDVLGVRGYEEYKPVNYHLGKYSNRHLWFHLTLKILSSLAVLATARLIHGLLLVRVPGGGAAVLHRLTPGRGGRQAAQRRRSHHVDDTEAQLQGSHGGEHTHSFNNLLFQVWF